MGFTLLVTDILTISITAQNTQMRLSMHAYRSSYVCTHPTILQKPESAYIFKATSINGGQLYGQAMRSSGLKFHQKMADKRN